MQGLGGVEEGLKVTRPRGKYFVGCCKEQSWRGVPATVALAEGGWQVPKGSCFSPRRPSPFAPTVSLSHVETSSSRPGAFATTAEPASRGLEVTDAPLPLLVPTEQTEIKAASLQSCTKKTLKALLSQPECSLCYLGQKPHFREAQRAA